MLRLFSHAHRQTERRATKTRFFAVLLAMVGVFTCAVCATIGLTWLTTRNVEVTFESAESRTPSGGPVFNRVRYIADGLLESGPAGGLWLLTQSHSGRNALDTDAADHLSIHVESKPPSQNHSTPGNRTARFAQWHAPLSSSPKENRSNHNVTKEVDYTVPCGLCHANGPRLIRPRQDSKEAPVSWRGRLMIAALNVRIVLAGRISAVEFSVLTNETQRRVPFLPHDAKARERLSLPACAKCHGGDGLLAREPLLRAHFLSVGFLLREGAMPPGWRSLSPDEHKSLKKFYSPML